MEENKRDWVAWNIRVTPQLDDMVLDHITDSEFATKAEFIREAVRDKLRDSLLGVGKV